MTWFHLTIKKGKRKKRAHKKWMKKSGRVGYMDELHWSKINNPESWSTNIHRVPTMGLPYWYVFFVIKYFKWLL